MKWHSLKDWRKD